MKAHPSWLNWLIAGWLFSSAFRSLVAADWLWASALGLIGFWNVMMAVRLDRQQ